MRNIFHHLVFYCLIVGIVGEVSVLEYRSLLYPLPSAAVCGWDFLSLVLGDNNNFMNNLATKASQNAAKNRRYFQLTRTLKEFDSKTILQATNQLNIKLLPRVRKRLIRKLRLRPVDVKTIELGQVEALAGQLLSNVTTANPDSGRVIKGRPETKGNGKSIIDILGMKGKGLKGLTELAGGLTGQLLENNKESKGLGLLKGLFGQFLGTTLSPALGVTDEPPINATTTAPCRRNLRGECVGFRSRPRGRGGRRKTKKESVEVDEYGSRMVPPGDNDYSDAAGGATPKSSNEVDSPLGGGDSDVSDEREYNATAWIGPKQGLNDQISPEDYYYDMNANLKCSKAGGDELSLAFYLDSIVKECHEIVDTMMSIDAYYDTNENETNAARPSTTTTNDNSITWEPLVVLQSSMLYARYVVDNKTSNDNQRLEKFLAARIREPFCGIFNFSGNLGRSWADVRRNGLFQGFTTSLGEISEASCATARARIYNSTIESSAEANRRNETGRSLSKEETAIMAICDALADICREFVLTAVTVRTEDFWNLFYDFTRGNVTNQKTDTNYFMIY